MQTAENVKFYINPLHNKGYILTVAFLDKKQGVLFNRNIPFTQSSYISKNKHIIWNVFTKNGITNPNALTEQLFNGNDIKQVKNVQNFLSYEGPASFFDKNISQEIAHLQMQEQNK